MMLDISQKAQFSSFRNLYYSVQDIFFKRRIHFSDIMEVNKSHCSLLIFSLKRSKEKIKSQGRSSVVSHNFIWWLTCSILSCNNMIEQLGCRIWMSCWLFLLGTHLLLWGNHLITWRLSGVLWKSALSTKRNRKSCQALKREGCQDPSADAAWEALFIPNVIWCVCFWLVPN